MRLGHFRIASFRVRAALAIGALVIGLAGTVVYLLGHMLSNRLRDDAASAPQVVAGPAPASSPAGSSNA